MSWTKLTAAGDWDTYKQRAGDRMGLAGVKVTWGDGPAAYPCLAASTLAYDPHPEAGPPVIKVLTCFVLPADARDLLGMPEGRADGRQDAVVAAQPDDTEFRRYVVAHLFTLLSELLSVGVTNRERYEAAFTGFLADVDRTTVGRADNVSPAAIFDRVRG